MELSVFYDHILNASKQQNISIDKILSKIKAFGIDYVEIDSYFLETDFKKVTKQLKKAELSISCVYKTFDFTHGNDKESAMEFVNLAKKANAKNILLIPGFCEPESMDMAFEKSIPIMKEVCDYAISMGIRPTIEDFDNEKSPCSTWEGVKKYADAIHNLWIAFDTGNFLYSGQDVLKAYMELSHKIAHVHLKDRILEDNGSDCCVSINGKNMYSGAVGDGCIPMKSLFAELKKADYKGIFAIEHFGAMDHLDAIERSTFYIRRNYAD